jgi:Zn-dependent protease/CBS domain-containing protein
MRPSIRLGRIFGIEIGLHYSWFLIAALIMVSLAGHFSMVNPQWSAGVRWSLAAVTGLLFFASILAHELSHALIANRRGIPVRSITLFALGGVANVERESSDAASEFWMAIAGPIASVIVGLVFLGIARLAGWQPSAGTPPSPLWAGFVWLGYINVALAVFNMIPGYPLDGGRVLRAIVWGINHNPVRATRFSADVGQFIAIAFIVFGFFRFFFAGTFGGLWLALIGWFLSDAAAASRATADISVALGNVRAGDVMSQDCPAVEGNLNLRTFAEDYLMRTGRRCFVVLQNGRHWGLVSIDQLKAADRNRWALTTVADIAVPLDRLRAVSPETPLATALELMARENINQLPVISNGELAGIISRANIVQYMETRQELKAA